MEKIIKKRRSIRRYKNLPPSEELIEKILKNVVWAPSPSNIQPVRYIRIESEDIKKRLYYNMCEGKKKLIERCQAYKKLKTWIEIYYSRYCSFMFDAPVLFAVGLTKRKKDGFYTRLSNSGIETNYDQSSVYNISLGISVSYFILEAESLGLGTCILTAPFLFIDNVNEILGIDGIDIKCFITLGFADELPEAPNRLSVSDICIKR